VLFDERTEGVDVAIARSGDYRSVALLHASGLDGARALRLAWRNDNFNLRFFARSAVRITRFSHAYALAALAQVLLDVAIARAEGSES
jgi:hypothetical protein